MGKDVQLHRKAREIAARYLFTPDTRVTVTPIREGVIVEAGGRGWWVSHLAGGLPPSKGDAYELFDVRPAVAADPPPPPRGFAQVSDGTLYNLKDEAQFERFFQAMHSNIQPLELAALLSRYQGGKHTQRLLDSPATLQQIIYPEDFAMLGELVEPRVERGPDGYLLRFASYYFLPEPPDRVYRTNFDRWRVEAGQDGSLDWYSEPLAWALNSPIYSPR